ncbi:unnamed protein product [Linum trigynum]|uniref:Uncharacterized protein n=1 Tax=Linum trigynum TaxID=586398 RepID=A0AAV2E6B4_9ROSI
MEKERGSVELPRALPEVERKESLKDKPLEKKEGAINGESSIAATEMKALRKEETSRDEAATGLAASPELEKESSTMAGGVTANERKEEVGAVLCPNARSLPMIGVAPHNRALLGLIGRAEVLVWPRAIDCVVKEGVRGFGPGMKEESSGLNSDQIDQLVRMQTRINWAESGPYCELVGS